MTGPRGPRNTQSYSDVTFTDFGFLQKHNQLGTTIVPHLKIWASFLIFFFMFNIFLLYIQHRLVTSI